MVPASEIEKRLERFQSSLSSAQPPLDVAIVIDCVDLYYLSGTIQTSHLLVPREGAPRLCVRKVLERAREDSPLQDIRPLKSLKSLRDELTRLCGPPPWRVGMELDVLPARTFDMYRELLGGDGSEFTDISGDLLGIRAVKTEWEIDQIRAAAEINDRLYRELPELLSAGLSTYQLQAVLDCRARTAGHLGVVRMRGFNVDGLIGVVVSGPSGAVPGHSQFPIGGEGPHPYIAHGGDNRAIEPDTPITFDYLANRTGYHHDQTRMAVLGRFPAEAERILDGMRGILRTVEGRLRPGAIPSEIYSEAVDSARALGFGDGFMGPPGYAVGFLGHAVGLEVNELPVLAPRFDAPIVPGNVFAVEPKFTHADYGVVGIENTYVVREDGAENLSISPEGVVVGRVG